MTNISLNDIPDHVSYYNDDMIIVDKIQELSEQHTIYSEYVVLLICTAGKLQIVYDGQTVVINKNCLFIGASECVFSDYLLSPDFDCKIVAIKPSKAVDSHATHSQIVNSLLHIRTHPVAQLTDDEMATVTNYYNLLCHQVKSAPYRYSKTEIRTLLNAFFFYVVGIMDQEMEAPTTTTTLHGEKIVERFLWLASQDGGHNRFVGYYADQLNVTAKYLSMLVRSTLNRTPSEVIRTITIKEIERRLRYTADSIKEISNSMNFPNTSFFGKYFKQYVGMTPNTYRKNNHQ